MASTHLVALAGSAVVFSRVLVLWWVSPLIRAHRGARGGAEAEGDIPR